MGKYEYHINVFYTANCDYTGYNDMFEVVDEFRTFVKEHMCRDFRMGFGLTEYEIMSSAVFSSCDEALAELDFLQESMDVFSKYCFADLYADAYISRREKETGVFRTLLNLHIRQQ